MLNNNICNQEEVVFGSDLSIIQEQFKEEWINTIKPFLNLKKSILVNNAPNRIGKTITTLKTLLKTNKNVLYVSDRHKQIKEVDEILQNEKFRHWWGLKHLCSQKNNCNRGFLIENDTPAKYVCNDCMVKKSCGYINQFDMEGISMVGAPKEYLMFSHIDKLEPEAIIFDENIEKGRKIEPTLPDLDESIFVEFDVEYIHLDYLVIKDILEDPNYELEEDILEQLKEDANFILSKKLAIIINKIKNIYIKSDSEKISDLLKFLFKLQTTIEFLEYCSKTGYNDSFQIPYIYDAFDLMEEYDCNLIILNTSLDLEILEMIMNGHDKILPEPILFEYPVINSKSYLLHYNYHNRSLSKSKLFKTDENGKICLDDNQKAIINPETYAKEIFDMVFSILEHSKKLGLKTGLITFKKAESLFHGKADVISHFRGHQGSNEFDDVDLLIILGTFHINPGGLYKIFQSITQIYSTKKGRMEQLSTYKRYENYIQ